MGKLLPLRLSVRVANASAPDPLVRPSSPPPPLTPHTVPPAMPQSLSRSQRVAVELPPPIPKTDSEWRAYLDDVRNLYLKRQYKQCSSRCIQVLEDAAEPLVPLHSIYLSFYAASCLELTARPLHANSSQKTFLYELARFHYQKAEYHLADAAIEDRSLRRQVDHFRQVSTCSNSSLSSKRSSLDSSTASLSSRGHLSFMPSPASSICSSPSVSTYQDDFGDLLKARPLLWKKKANFTPSLPTVISVSDITNGLINPKNPSCTENYHSNTLTLASIRTALASSPSATSHCSVNTARSRAGSDASIASIDSLYLSPMAETGPARPDSASFASFSPFEGQDEDRDSDGMRSFFLSRSIARYNTHLDSMAMQLRYHITVLEALIEEIALARSSNTSITSPSSCISHSRSHDKTDDNSTTLPKVKRDCKLGNKHDSYDRLNRQESDRNTTEEEQQEEKRRVRKERMEQWPNRERFNGRRWEKLAEQALRELDC